MLLDGIVGLGGVISKPYRGALKHGPRGFAKGLVQGALCVLRPPIGVLDLLTKTVEGLIHSPFLGVRRHLRQQQPFALHANRLVAPFNAEESRAYELLSLCSPAAPARGGRGGRAEFFQAQHPIEYRDGMRLEQRVALAPRRVRVDQWFDGRCNRTERLLGARHHAARRLRPPRAARGGG
uniref:Vacuolar protein sorting-associated protein 13 DH-like domain-containing protein n=2 Tax=Emiliania huxleyi TaxID=2903 RepID=A0A7S3SAZ6_EMIHU